MIEKMTVRAVQSEQFAGFLIIIVR